jgi:hypothetical protein
MGAKIRKLVIGLLIVAIPLGAIAWYYLLRQVPVRFNADEEYFKYGSVGVEAASGIPYWIWEVLPRVFADKLPAGFKAYADFGFISEQGREGPVGLPIMTVGFKRLGINCGLCHTAAIRKDPGDEPVIIPGAPTGTLDLQAYLRFLFACAEDPRFDADTLIPAIEAVYDLPFIEGLLYRYLVIPQMKKTLMKQRAQTAWMDTAPDWGPGRQDPFNPAKSQILKLPYDGSVGAADVVPLWNWEKHQGFALHWDGLNTSLEEVLLNSGIGNGASNETIDIEGLHRIGAYITKLPPPPYPFSIDRALAERGAAVFANTCAGCHAFGSPQVGQPMRMERLGTDRERLASWSQAVADAFQALDLYSWQYTHFRDSFGYVAVALDGIWARAPYLHNGSVPSLRYLLGPPVRRPVIFHRGYNVYAPEDVGFVSSGPEAVKVGRAFDTRLRGNGNGGHDFGTDLSDEDKSALLEYLKTL